MHADAELPSEYLAAVPPDKFEALNKLRNVIVHNLPEGFEETISNGMITYVVPHGLYPAGYHSNPKQPLPFLSLAAQKNSLAVYHMGMYADQELLEWFTGSYANFGMGKPDMGKSCIRFKNPERIPYSLIRELASKRSPHQWIEIYEATVKPKN